MQAAPYMQVLSLGLIWTFFHCSGMCGPLVAGLTSRPSDPVGRLARLVRRSRRVLAYQLGRATTYAAMGAAAGLAGAAFEHTVRDVAALSGFVVAPIVALLGLASLSGRRMGDAFGAKFGGYVGAALRGVRRLTVARGELVTSALTGLVLGLLPCVLMFWTLGIAATTASPLHGAGVMLTLVALTTPTLLVAGCAASAARARWSERAVGVVLLVSALWMLLVALAANGAVPHAQATFALFGDPFMVMFF